MYSLGKILYELRTNSDMSRRKLALMLDCTEITIKRIEEGQSKFSDYMIEQVNKIFDINVYEYYGITSRYGSYKAYIKCKKLKTAIDTYNFESIEFYIKQFETDIDFSVGDPYLLLCYAKIFICDDTENSIKLCYSALNVSNFTEVLNVIGNVKLNNNIYSILIVLNANLVELNLIDDAFNLSEKLYLHFKEVIFHNEIRLEKYHFDTQKKFISIINNYAHLNYMNKSYEKALDILEEGISSCVTFNTLHGIEYLYLLKMEVYYALGNIEESLKFKNCFMVFCDAKGNKLLFEKIKKKIESEYPELIS